MVEDLDCDFTSSGYHRFPQEKPKKTCHRHRAHSCKFVEHSLPDSWGCLSLILSVYAEAKKEIKAKRDWTLATASSFKTSSSSKKNHVEYVSSFIHSFAHSPGPSGSGKEAKKLVQLLRASLHNCGGGVLWSNLGHPFDPPAFVKIALRTVAPILYMPPHLPLLL